MSFFGKCGCNTKDGNTQLRASDTTKKKIAHFSAEILNYPKVAQGRRPRMDDALAC